MDEATKTILSSIDKRLENIEKFILAQADKNGRTFVYNLVTWVVLLAAISGSIKAWIQV